MTDRRSVEVDLRSVRRAWREADYGDFWIEVRTGDDAGGAIERALSSLDPEEWGDEIIGDRPTKSPAGFVTQLSGVRDDDHLQSWLDLFAAELDAAGIDGTIAGTRPVDLPAWMGSANARSEPAAFIAWTVDIDAMVADPRREGHWLIPESSTKIICDLFGGWVARGGSNIIFLNGSIRLALDDPSTLGPILARTVSTTGIAHAIVHDDDPIRARLVRLEPQGRTALLAMGRHLSGPEQIDALSRSCAPDAT